MICSNCGSGGLRLFSRIRQSRLSVHGLKPNAVCLNCGRFTFSIEKVKPLSAAGKNTVVNVLALRLEEVVRNDRCANHLFVASKLVVAGVGSLDELTMRLVSLGLSEEDAAQAAKDLSERLEGH
jgi:hypothetical protein